MAALAPQPGVLGDAKIYAFPGANGNGTSGTQDITKLMLSTSGLTLMTALLEEGKLESLLGKLTQSIRSNGGKIPESLETLSEAVKSPNPKSKRKPAANVPPPPPLPQALPNSKRNPQDGSPNESAKT